jgi:hypothetical protein
VGEAGDAAPDDHQELAEVGYDLADSPQDSQADGIHACFLPARSAAVKLRRRTHTIVSME